MRARFELINHDSSQPWPLPDKSVHCIVTSVPYWGLRDYGIPASIWGGDPEHKHEWGESVRAPWANGISGPNGVQKNTAKNWTKESGSFCSCGAWRGCLGLEPTPYMFVDHIVQVFREAWRVLRDDGTLWLNLGDCYATGAGSVGNCPGGGEQGARWRGDAPARNDAKGRGTSSKCDGRGGHVYYGPMTQPNRMPQEGLKAKDLVGMPWRVAFALQASGWYLRSEIIWAKPNPMPDSVQDRPTRNHEQVFLLTKKERYFYDIEAIREPVGRLGRSGSKTPAGWEKGKAYKSGNSQRVLEVPTRPNDHRGSSVPWEDDGRGRNRRTVWTITTQPTPDAHFATFPEKLVEPCILAGTSEKGCCAECGAPYKRITQPTPEYAELLGKDWSISELDDAEGRGHFQLGGKSAQKATQRPVKRNGASISSDYVTTGWEKTCKCEADEIVPCTVLDPFAGSGTTCKVAVMHGRRGIGLELNPEYIKIAERKVGPLFGLVT